MRLLFVHDGPVFFDGQDYFEYSFHKLLERYRIFEPEITFITRVESSSNNTTYTLLPKEIEVVETPNFKDPRCFLKNKTIAKRIIDKAVSRSDMLILRDSNNADIAFDCAKHYKIPFIYECVGCTWDAFWNHSTMGKIIAAPMFFRRRRIIKQSDYVHYVTSSFLQQRYPTQGRTLACSDVCIEHPKQSTLEKRLNKIGKMDKTQTIHLGTAAAVDVRYKGQEYVIRAIPLLLEAGLDIDYLLAGGNRLNSPYLQNLAESLGVADRVRFLGSLGADELPAFYDFLDVYIQPSKQEGLPRSVIEAMSHACPVIGSNIAGIPELIGKDCLFPKGNSEAIAKTLQKTLDSNLADIALHNFQKSHEYIEEALERKRIAFYREFIDNELHGAASSSK